MCQLTYTLIMIPQAEALVTPPENRGTRDQGNVAGIELGSEPGGLALSLCLEPVLC